MTSRFYGKIGYAEPSKEDPNQVGVWKENVVERSYFGDVTREARQLGDGSKVNNDITPSTTLSVIADPYALNHFSQIRYVFWAGTPWLVTSVSIQERRLLLTLGGVYNGVRP